MIERTWLELTRERHAGFRRLSYPIRTGLTLIPMLLIILAIVMPVFQSARHVSRGKSCISNVKQVSLGALMYAQDYDETFPIGTRSNRQEFFRVKDTPLKAKFHVGQGWAGAVYPYLKNFGVFQCPADETKAARGMYPVSYAYNRNMALTPMKAAMSQPEATVLLAEVAENRANVVNAEERGEENVHSAAGNGLNVLAATDGVMEPEVSAGARYATGIMGGYGKKEGCPVWSLDAPQEEKPRHNGMSLALADGHAKFFSSDSVSPGDNAIHAKQAQDCTHSRAAGTANRGWFRATFSTK